MPVIQKFTINTPNAAEGQIYGLSQHMYIRTVEANTATVAMGKPVKATPNTVRNVDPDTKPANATTKCYGIIVRQVNHEAASRPSTDGIMAMNKGDVLGMMVEGQIMIKLHSAVTRDAKMQFDPATGWSGTAANAYTNVVALKAGAAGDIIPVRIFQA